MKKMLFIIIGLLSFFKMFAQLGYLCEDKFIQLIPSLSGQYYVQTRNADSKRNLEKIAYMEHRQNNRKNEVYVISENSFFVSSKSNLSKDDYISELFHDIKGNPYYILPRIIISLKDNTHISNVIKGYSGILELDSIQRLKGMTTLSCNLSRAQEVLRVVGELDSYEEVEWCEPDMILKWEPHDSNPFFSLQYYLQNGNSGQYDINVVPAWGFATGNSNIIVAVIDEGVDSDHEDLSGNVLQGYTIGDATGYGRPKNANEFNRKGHGVACAGIIGAKDNDKGILGGAYGVKILPVNIAPYTPSGHYANGNKIVDYSGWSACNSNLAYAIQWASERADILSCSWGGGSGCNAVISAINNAMTNGRNGKGCVVVASSGNGYYNGLTTIEFPARMDGVIAVGAINRYGNIQTYSQRGSDLDLVAPSGLCNLQGDVVTTDRAGYLGYNPYEVPSGTDLSDMGYTQKFGGTSAACPQVAGVAALMLSANPYLTASQVRSKLCNSARKLPGMNGQNRTDTYGYGLVNALAAVIHAKNLKIDGPELVYTYSQFDIVNLPSGLTVSWSLSNSHYNNGYNLLIPNYPTTGHCLIIRDQYYDLINDTLKAQIKYNGVTLRTLTKIVNAYDGFRGHFSSADLSGDITFPYIFYVRTNTGTTVTSLNFYGATVSYSSSGAIPTGWGFHPDTGVLDFTTATPSTPVIINVNDVFGNSYVLYAFGSNQYGINVSNGENGITVTLNEDGDSEKGMNQYPSWMAEIRNAMTGALMTTQTSTSRSETISTAGWPKGFYIVKVTIGKEVMTEKVIVR